MKKLNQVLGLLILLTLATVITGCGKKEESSGGTTAFTMSKPNLKCEGINGEDCI